MCSTTMLLGNPINEIFNLGIYNLNSFDSIYQARVNEIDPFNHTFF